MTRILVLLLAGALSACATEPGRGALRQAQDCDCCAPLGVAISRAGSAAPAPRTHTKPEKEVEHVG
jgi:hypothetical protein